MGDKAAAFFKLVAWQATSTISEAAAFEAYWLRCLSLVDRRQLASLLRRHLAATRRLVPADPRLLNVDPRAHVRIFITPALCIPALTPECSCLGND